MADSFISAIFTYPIKSCGALSHQTVELDSRGPVNDRRWMVTDTDGMAITQREISALALVQPSFKDDCLALNAPEMPEMRIPLHYTLGHIRQAEVWGDVCKAWDEGEAAAEWFSDYLRTDVRLMRMADGFVRRVDERYAPHPAQTAFSDGYPLLIVSEKSLDELNRRLIERGKTPVPMNRFRPNLVISGSDAFAEDSWRMVQIGSLTLDVVKPCARCVMTTVDPVTGTVPDSAEPLATLNTFRKQNGKVMFAQNAIHRRPGHLAVGDILNIIERQK